MATIEVKNQNILVTGAAAGIGRGVVKKLCGQNKVYALDRNGELLDQLKKEFPGVVTLQCDLSNWEETRRVLEENLPEIVHGLVNNAGIGAEGGFMNCTEDKLDRYGIFNVK